MAKLPSHHSYLTVKHITLHSGYNLVLQELFKGRYQVGKETGRKQRLRGDLIATLFPCSDFETINILNYHTIKKEESLLLLFVPGFYNQHQQSHNYKLKLTQLSKARVLFSSIPKYAGTQ